MLGGLPRIMGFVILLSPSGRILGQQAYPKIRRDGSFHIPFGSQFINILSFDAINKRA